MRSDRSAFCTRFACLSSPDSSSKRYVSAYLIWYTAVQRIGSARTSTYSNMVPAAALIVAIIWLREPVAPLKRAGAAAILGGVLLTVRRVAAAGSVALIALRFHRCDGRLIAPEEN